MYFSGHKSIVWPMADCLINEPFFSSINTQKSFHKKAKFLQWTFLLGQVMHETFGAVPADVNEERFIELIDVAFNDQID